MTWNPFKSKKAEAEQPQASAKQGGKGRPTPSRKQAQAKEYRPLVPTNEERKARYKEEKKRLRARQDRQYEAMEQGDLRNMPRAEQLPIRVYVRDYVDARRNLAEWFLPVCLVCIVLAFIFGMIPQLAILSFVVVVLMYVYMLAAIVDMFVMWLHGLKPQLVAKFGTDKIKAARCASYAVMRAMNVRRWRIPKPRSAKRGEWPR